MLAVCVISFSVIQSEKISKNFNGVQVSGDKNQSRRTFSTKLALFICLSSYTLFSQLSLCSREDKEKNAFS